MGAVERVGQLMLFEHQVDHLGACEQSRQGGLALESGGFGLAGDIRELVGHFPEQGPFANQRRDVGAGPGSQGVTREFNGVLFPFDVGGRCPEALGDRAIQAGIVLRAVPVISS
jgi:hypothetical protein